MLAKMLFLPMMLKVLDKSRRSVLCAVLYAAIILTNCLIFDLAFGANPGKLAVSLAVAFFGSLLYFKALLELEGTGMLYWGVFVLGIALLVRF